jgi:hypothetical protein
MSVVQKAYRVNGTDDYLIEYRRGSWWSGTWTIHCLRHPHNPYSTSVNDCHLYASGQVCVAAGKEPSSLDRAKAIAQFWMHGYSAYVRSGVFNNGSGRVNV